MAQVEDSDDIEVVYAHLTNKAKRLLSDLEAFHKFTSSHDGKTLRPEFGYTKFHADVQREAKLLEKHGAAFNAKLTEPMQPDPKDSLDGLWPVSTAGKFATELHQIRSSNISHLDLIWQDVLNSNGVLGIRKSVRYTRGPPKRDPQIRVPDKHNFHARQRSQQLMQLEQQKQEAKDRQVYQQRPHSFYPPHSPPPPPPPPPPQQPFYSMSPQQTYQQWQVPSISNQNYSPQVPYAQPPEMIFYQQSAEQSSFLSHQQTHAFPGQRMLQMPPIQQPMFNQVEQFPVYSHAVPYGPWPQQQTAFQQSWRPMIPQYPYLPPYLQSRPHYGHQQQPNTLATTNQGHPLPLSEKSSSKQQDDTQAGEYRSDNKQPVHPGRNDRDTVVVDIICEHGARWIKLFTKTQRWLALDLAKEGLVELGCDSDEERDKTGDEFFNAKDKELLEDIKLVKMAREYLRAARSARVNHRHPQIHFHLPKISRGFDDDVDVVIRYLESIGVTVIDAVQLKDAWNPARPSEERAESKDVQEYFRQLGITREIKGDVQEHEYEEETREIDSEAGEYPETMSNGSGTTQEPISTSEILSNGDTPQPSSLATTPEAQERQPCQIDDAASSSQLLAAFERMTSLAEIDPLTATLNVDCTVLIALISEISHRPRGAIRLPVHYSGRSAGKDIEMQMDSEESDALLPNHLYPLLRGKRLICTDKAATHLKSIVQLMGSPDETLRSHLILQYPTSSFRSAESVRTSFGELSSHQVPTDLELPIQVTPAAATNHDPQSLDGQIMAMLVDHPRLSPLNQSVFYYGWQTDTTTVSLNRVVSEWLGRAVDGCLDDIEWRENIENDIVEAKAFRGPRMRICGRERSLVGNEKFRNGKRYSGYG